MGIEAKPKNNRNRQRFGTSDFYRRGPMREKDALSGSVGAFVGRLPSQRQGFRKIKPVSGKPMQIPLSLKSRQRQAAKNPSNGRS